MAFWGRFFSGHHHNTGSSAASMHSGLAESSATPGSAAGNKLPMGDLGDVCGGRPLTATRAFEMPTANLYQRSRPITSGGLLAVLMATWALVIFMLTDSHARRQIADALIFPNESATIQPNYFAIGSTKEEVISVQGTPTEESGSVWRYGRSEVRFAGVRVCGWRSSPGIHLKTLPLVPSFSFPQ
jgi:hypothetical protein